LAPVELLLALCLAGSRIAFIYALPLTTVASVMVFQAVSPRGATRLGLAERAAEAANAVGDPRRLREGV
jgi:hypothetical protein